MKMNDVELLGTLQHFFEHYKMVSELVLAFIAVQPQCLGAAWDQSCGRF
jgi:hypothetical protein